MHFVTEEGTFDNENGYFKNKPVANEISPFCLSTVRSSSFAGYVQVLTTSCQKKKIFLKKYHSKKFDL